MSSTQLLLTLLIWIAATASNVRAGWWAIATLCAGMVIVYAVRYHASLIREEKGSAESGSTEVPLSRSK